MVKKLETITIGNVFKLTYFLTLQKHRRVFTFGGVCMNWRKKSKTMHLRNFHNVVRENLEINFFSLAPYIIKMEKFLGYNLGKDRKKIKNSKVKPPKRSFYHLAAERKFDPYDFIYTVNFTVTEKHRLRGKFRI